jgi:signal transduction histidine kinase
MDIVAHQPAYRWPPPQAPVHPAPVHPAPVHPAPVHPAPVPAQSVPGRRKVPMEGKGIWSRLRRPRGPRVVAGVAGALSDVFGVTTPAVRIAFVALGFAGGTGLAAYMFLWLFLPAEGEEETIARRALSDRRTMPLALAAASGIAAVMVAAGIAGVGVPLGMVAPGGVALAGLVAVWRHAGSGDREALQHLVNQLSGANSSAVPTRRRLCVAFCRLAVGVALVGAGSSAFLAPTHLTGTDVRVLLGALAVVGGFVLVLAPWWLRLGRDLAAERRQRARAEERAEVASHLHDSVLQTLALIQRNSDDSQQVKRLARVQERQLRAWLFGGAPAGPLFTGAATTLAEAVTSLQQEIEADHGARVEVVTVGDCPLDERLDALVAATREAVVNAAKWSGAEVISVFAEVEPRSISVFVRDRGRGFDLDAVPQDRKGISQSICARVERNGGKASVRSTPGEGTEVTMEMPRGSAP